MAEQKRIRPPLGIPPGSVRALLSLMIVAVVIIEIIRGRELSLSLTESLMMVLALYFAVRGVIHLPHAKIRELQQEGRIPVEKPPLYLPRFSIRAIIVLSFAGAAAYLYRENRLLTNQALGSLGLVAAYLVGAVLRPIGRLLRRWELPEALLDRLADLRALIVLGAVGTLTVCYALDITDQLPPWGERAALNLLLFYFGAR